MNNKDIQFEYIGQFINNQRHGVGIQSATLVCGQYEGEWINDQMHGFGVKQYVNDERDGIYPCMCGDKYSGQFVSGKRCGYGEFNFTTNDNYAGEY